MTAASATGNNAITANDREFAIVITDIEKLVAQRLSRMPNLRVPVTPGARKRPTPLTAEDRALVRSVCVQYALADAAVYDPHDWGRYLASAASSTHLNVGRTSAAPRQHALYRSLCSALDACAGHATAGRALRRAYARAFGAVAPRNQDPGDLVLELYDALAERRADLPAGVRARVAYAYAHALDPYKFPRGSTDEKQSERDVQTRRRRRREKTRRPGNRDIGVLLVL